jgi:uncharacterized membrane protein YcaP (DUF421 family)
MEIVVRATVVFFFLWLVTRVVGRSTLGELSTFQLLLFVTMGDLVQQSVTQQDYSVTSGVLAVSTFALLTVGLSYTKWRWPRARPLIHGVPVVVVSDGEPVVEAMRAERLTLDDLMAAAREQGFERFADMRLAVLEADGGISFFRRSDGESSGAPEKPAVAAAP